MPLYPRGAEDLMKYNSHLHNVCAVRRGCAVHQGMFSTLADIMSTVGGYHEYTGGVQ